MEICKIENLYDLSASLAGKYLEKLEYPWEALDHIKDWVLEIGAGLDPEIYEKRDEDIWVAKTAKIYPTATIIGPAIIGERTEVRPGAFIRGNAIIGNDCVVGNSTEIKNDIIFDHVQVPHYNYVGDSVLGTYSHMGAGSITSNVKSDKTHVVVKYNGEWIDTGRKKFGAMLGDHVEVGCNTVLNPGTVVGRNSTIYPVSMVRGVIPADSIYKNKAVFEIVPKDSSLRSE